MQPQAVATSLSRLPRRHFEGSRDGGRECLRAKVTVHGMSVPLLGQRVQLRSGLQELVHAGTEGAGKEAANKAPLRPGRRPQGRWGDPAGADRLPAVAEGSGPRSARGWPGGMASRTGLMEPLPAQRWPRMTVAPAFQASPVANPRCRRLPWSPTPPPLSASAARSRVSGLRVLPGLPVLRVCPAASLHLLPGSGHRRRGRGRALRLCPEPPGAGS